MSSYALGAGPFFDVKPLDNEEVEKSGDETGDKLDEKGSRVKTRLRVDWRMIIMKNFVISLKMGLVRLLCGEERGEDTEDKLEVGRGRNLMRMMWSLV